MAITASHRGRSRSRCFVPAVTSASGLSRSGSLDPDAGTRVMRKLVRQPTTATVVSTTPIFHSAVFHAVNRNGPMDVPSTMATSVVISSSALARERSRSETSSGTMEYLAGLNTV